MLLTSQEVRLSDIFVLNCLLRVLIVLKVHFQNI